MKYGYNDRSWCVNDVSALTEGIERFNREIYLPFMRRKTAQTAELEWLKMLQEMVALMQEHAAEIPVKDRKH